MIKRSKCQSLSATRISWLIFFLTAIFPSAFAQQPTDFTSFKPGAEWRADDGLPIDCHGGNIIYVDSLKTFFWYGEHYGNPRGAACYSSKDLYNWKNEGVVMTKGDIEIFERPKVIYDEINKKYVMWFHYDGNRYSIAELGVAVSDKPTGPFKLQNHFRPNGHESRDIGLYVDPETKKTYIGYAADHVNRTIRMVELSGDYLNVTGNDVDINAHCEGPGILKKNGTFYLLTSGCSGWTPNPGHYYTSKAITGPYAIQGSPFVGDAGDNSFNSQPCYIFKIPGYKDAYLYMGDRWNGSGSPKSQYVFLPITITPGGQMEIHFYREWDLNIFTPEKKK
ncbi:MAG: glycoside hydrolase family 43 protein [Ginsengibacter sp.]